MPLVALIGVLTIACHPLSEKESTRYLVKTENAAHYKCSEILDSVHISKLTLPDSVGLGAISTAKKYDNYLLLASNYGSQSLVCFKDNSFLFHLDKLGSGPGEYLSLYDFCVNRNELLVLDRDQQKLLFYSLNGGTFIREIKTGQFNCAIESLSPDVVILGTDYSDKPVFHYLYLQNMRNGKVIPLLQTSGGLLPEAIYSQNFTKLNNHVYFTEPFTERIYTLTTEGCKEILRIDFGQRKIPESWNTWSSEYAEAQLATGKYAFGCKMYNPSGSKLALIYHTNIDTYNLLLADLKTKRQLIVKNLSEELTGQSIPMPHLVDKGRYLSVFTTDMINLEPNDYWSEKLKDQFFTEQDIVCVYFVIKFPDLP
ncbi:MAG: hypothetical protein KatS3mg032_2087 [Cyclobacteriaceae bacterium]|nr:MAG: hypothetical protein KatS3mg032_2087 [Cyclobacteriaceae bacterium]